MGLKAKTNNFLSPFVPKSILNRYLSYKWEKQGKPVPPPHIIKQKIIAKYQQEYRYDVLVETGTYLGTMIEAQKNRFKKIISIELGVELYKNAKNRFKKENHIQIIHGDSGEVLPQIIPKITQPAIFWLDGHFSEGITAKGEKDCPIYKELNAILISQKHSHILLIDDARHFVGLGDYPTINELTKHVKSINGKYQVEIKDDVIRYTL